jgi:hypothetical protein
MKHPRGFESPGYRLSLCHVETGGDALSFSNSSREQLDPNGMVFTKVRTRLLFRQARLRDNLKQRQDVLSTGKLSLADAADGMSFGGL